MIAFQRLPTRRMAIAALLSAGVGAACRSRSREASDGSSLLESAAEQYVRLTLQLAQHQPSLVEAWNGTREWLPGPRQPIATIRDDLEVLKAQLRQLDASARQAPRDKYLEGQVMALDVAARRLSGESMTFADEARAALVLPPSTWRDASDSFAGIERLLPGPGALHERVNALRRRHALRAAQVEAAFVAAIDACRDRVGRWVSLPRDERVTLTRVSGVGAEARATWVGALHTALRLDDRAAPDVAHLVWLAAHETYAGHHLQHVLAAGDSVTGRVPVERQLQPSFGPHLLYAEGAAEAGASLLLGGSAFAEMCEHVCRIAGVPSAGITELIAIHRAMLLVDLVIPQVAEAYLDGAVGQATAIERLGAEALVSDAASFLSVIEHQRTRLLAYPVGRRLVTQALSRGPIEEQWSRLTNISATLSIS